MEESSKITKEIEINTDKKTPARKVKKIIMPSDSESTEKKSYSRFSLENNKIETIKRSMNLEKTHPKPTL